MSLRAKGRVKRAVTVVAFLVLGNTFALAADPGEVEELIRRGVEYRRSGKDNLALPLFLKAYTLAPRPRTAAQLGLVEMALGYQVDAERHLMEGLAAPRDLWIQKNRATLESSLRAVKASIGEIVVDGSPRGADVVVNGTVVGHLPLKGPIRIGEGPCSVEVRSPGYSSMAISVNVVGEKREPIAANLKRLEAMAGMNAKNGVTPSPEPAETPLLGPPDKTDQESGDEGAKTITAAPPSEVDSAGYGSLRPWGWAAAVGAVAGLGFGIFETLTWQDRLDQFNSTTMLSAATPPRPIAACGADEPGRGRLPVCRTLYDEMTQAKTLSIVGYAVGGGLAVGAIVLFVMSRNSERSVAQAGLTCLPTGPLSGLTCRMSF